MKFKLRFRVMLLPLMAVVIFGGIASADLYLNDPYPRPGGDEIVSLSDPLFIQQSLDGTGCELMPVVDTDGDGADFKLGIIISEKILKAATGRDVLSISIRKETT